MSAGLATPSPIRAQAANSLSALRLVLAAIWVIAFIRGNREPAIFGSIAIAAALSDIADGPLARRMHSSGAAGRWVDGLADVTFVLTALICVSIAGAIPWYVPALIAISFAQYAIDSTLLRGSSVPIASRIGHWGGIVNFALAIIIGFAPPPAWPGVAVRAGSPVLAIFYIAGIIERALSYRSSRRV
jgi:phosphatidylglycerophosphate synthase